MTPLKFEESNLKLMPPAGSDDHVGTLHAIRDEVQIEGAGGEIYSYHRIRTAWCPTPEERETIAVGGYVILSLLGTSIPPSYLEVAAPGTLTEQESNGDID